MAREAASGTAAAGVGVDEDGLVEEAGAVAGSADGIRLPASSYFPGMCIVHPTISPTSPVPANHHDFLPIAKVSNAMPVSKS
jgi:hypothetical protein